MIPVEAEEDVEVVAVAVAAEEEVAAEEAAVKDLTKEESIQVVIRLKIGKPYPKNNLRKFKNFER